MEIQPSSQIGYFRRIRIHQRVGKIANESDVAPRLHALPAATRFASLRVC